MNVRCVLRVNECTMRLWNEGAMRLSEWVYDAFKSVRCVYGMNGRCVYVCVFFFFLSLCGCCGYVDMKCHAPMRPMFAAQWSEVSILYPGIQFALLIWGSTASWLVKVPLIIISWLNIGYQWCVCPLGACLSVIWLCFIFVNVCVYVCFLPVFFSLGPHCLRWQRFGCSSHVFCETGESGLSSHIQLRFYSGLFT